MIVRGGFLAMASALTLPLIVYLVWLAKRYGRDEAGSMIALALYYVVMVAIVFWGNR